MPTGIPFAGQTGLPTASKSLGRPPKPFFSVRSTVPYGAIGRNFDVYVHGDEAKFSFMTLLEIPWGTAEPDTFDLLAAGWTWKWDVNQEVLIITDADGVITTRPASTWSELAVSMGVITSHQFVYFFDGTKVPSPFIVVRRLLPNRNVERNGIQWGEFQRYVNATFHVLYHRMAMWFYGHGDKEGSAADSGDVTIQAKEFDAIIELRDILLAACRDLSDTGSFPLAANVQGTDYAFTAAAKKEARSVLVWGLGRWLFCAALTACLLGGTQNRGKPCYEPWMLFGMWKWLQGSIHPETFDRIIEISPSW